MRRVHRDRRRAGPSCPCAQPAERAAGKVDHDAGGAHARAAPRLWADAFVVAGASQCGFCSPGIVMKAEAHAGEEPVARPATRSPGRWPGTSAGAPATSRSSTRSSTRRRPSAASRCPRSTAAAGSGQPHRAVPGRRAGARRQAVRQRHGRARDAPRRAAVLRPPPGEGAADRHLEGRGAPGRGRGDHLEGRPRRADAGDDPAATGGSSWPRARSRATSATCSRRSPPRRAHAAREAAALIEVDYEVLEPVTDPFDALKPGAPQVAPRAATCCRSPT